MLKRLFDFSLSLFGLIILLPALFIISIGVVLTSKGGVIFSHRRVGRNNVDFHVYKFRTMRDNTGEKSELTLGNSDPRITGFGKFLRKYKLDELPQLFNVLIGDMSFVGPRPDVPGYADKLDGDSRRVLGMRPGITGPATLKYSNEEQFLAGVDNPKKYNDEVIFPDKVKINLEYMDNWSLWMDIKIIFKTIFRNNY